ncbi:hypothetical protein [Pontibacillus marinus]|uniref:Uncharacterized protein n=1 Tax=Pontibacillus marinus BH030004 = DSM 16465 TaxID=1385511 RepID=A0A0A5GKX8_9BACI|nr:hypothetical protein [Pontibacillus marinus]KGX91873.1 hypothetical protein N783_00340 [Pontibacillus marinus BH030004 = DSM 16465]
MKKLINLKRKCESARKQFHDACFELITEHRAYHGELVKGDIKKQDLETIQSLAYEIQDELNVFESYQRLTHWRDTISLISQDIIDKTEVGGDLYDLAQCKEEFHSDFYDEEGLHYEDIDSFLHDAQVEADLEKERMLENAKNDIFEIEEKLKQIGFLLDQVIQYPVGELSKGT